MRNRWLPVVAALAATVMDARGQSRPAPQAAQQTSANGIKVGDTVDILTGFGWIPGKVLVIDGNNYRVHSQAGPDVWKTYPAEVRRVGAPNAQDRANGIYQLHDKVQVLFEGRWINSEVVTILGMEYQVTLPGNRVAWARPDQLRPPLAVAPGAAAPAPAAKAAGVPCGAKLEGRWSDGNAVLNMEFRSGKVHVIAPLSNPETLDCFMNGDKIILRKAGAEDLIMRMNDDGTIDAPFAVLKKKGK